MQRASISAKLRLQMLQVSLDLIKGGFVMKSNKIFERPTLEVITFVAEDIMTASGCPLDVEVNPGGNGGDSGKDYGTPEY